MEELSVTWSLFPLQSLLLSSAGASSAPSTRWSPPRTSHQVSSRKCLLRTLRGQRVSDHNGEDGASTLMGRDREVPASRLQNLLGNPGS